MTYLLLHFLLMLFSIAPIFSKLAGQNEFMSPTFIIYYALVLLTLLIYAFFWQKIIKKMPLTLAYANKAVTIIWGAIWGILFFGESISLQKIIASAIIIVGIIMYAFSEKPKEASNCDN